MANGEIPVRPGWQTTEFWVTIATMIISILGMSGYITPDQQTVLTDASIKLGALVVMVAAAFGYSLSRGMAKKKS
jgi:hypothetical protein